MTNPPVDWTPSDGSDRYQTTVYPSVIPLYHDFNDETVLVFGGGSVGARKAHRFCREARVVVVSPAFDSRFREPELASIERVRAAPSPEDVGDWIGRFDPALVVAATNDTEVNAAIDEAASEKGILLNRANRAGSRDVDSVVVPATVRDGSVSVAISTDGTSPVLSRHLRQQLEAELEGVGAMAELTSRLRTELKTTDKTATERRAALRAVVESSTVWKALHTGTTNPRKEAKRVMAAEHDEMGGGR